MPAAQIFSALAGAVFVLVCSIVGGRLLWLARETRQLPELFIGAGLLSVAGVGFPLMIASGLGPNPVSEVRIPVMAAGLIAVVAGTVSLYAFTWRTFRPTSGWAGGLVMAAALTLAVVAVGTIQSFLEAPPDQDALHTGSGWMAWTRVAILVSYGWTGIESWLRYRMARRRLALGLAEPVVTNRLLLWSLTGALEVAINAVDLALHMNGVSLMVDSRAMAVTATGGVVASVMMYLTFLPPRVYLGWVMADDRPERA